MGFSFVERGISPVEREKNKSLLQEGENVFFYNWIGTCVVKTPQDKGEIFGYDANGCRLPGNGKDFVVLASETPLVKVFLKQTPTAPERRIGTIYWAENPKPTTP